MNGEIFDYIYEGGDLSEPICRFYFKQLLKALNFLHANGFCHRDIKLENILLDDEFNLKLVDFGFSCPLKGRNGKGFESRKLGTPMYMAPEIINGDFYKGEVVDLFAAAVCLFMMKNSNPPMERANIKDV